MKGDDVEHALDRERYFRKGAEGAATDEWSPYYAATDEVEPRVALRYNEGKPQLAQILWFRRGLEKLAEHMAAGRLKYPDQSDGTPNFMSGGKPDGEYLDAAMRHLAAYVNGETIDPETGTEHLSAVVWNILSAQTLNGDDQ